MAVTLRIRRGVKANLAAASTVSGEPLWATDEEKLYVSDGTDKYLIGPFWVPAENIDVDTGTEDVDTFATTLGDACTWFYKVKKSTNVRAGTITVAWEGTNIGTPAITQTTDLGDTSDLTFDVDINSGNVRLRATAVSDDWVVGVNRMVL